MKKTLPILDSIGTGRYIQLLLLVIAACKRASLPIITQPKSTSLIFRKIVLHLPVNLSQIGKNIKRCHWFIKSWIASLIIL